MMDKNVIEGSVPRASVPSDAKPVSGLGHRVNDAFAWWKSAFLSGEAYWTCGEGLNPPFDCRGRYSNAGVVQKDSAEGIVAP